MTAAIADFSPLSGLAGGALIGLGASVLLAFAGRIAGISGILSGALVPARGDFAWRALFLLGLVAGAALWFALAGAPPWRPGTGSLGVTAAAGLLVGLGTVLGSGCTSGHGVCGLARRSPRSIVATATFMTAGAATVFVVRHLLGLGG